jgi:hypothetical protein
MTDIRRQCRRYAQTPTPTPTGETLPRRNANAIIGSRSETL